MYRSRRAVVPSCRRAVVPQHMPGHSEPGSTLDHGPDAAPLRVVAEAHRVALDSAIWTH